LAAADVGVTLAPSSIHVRSVAISADVSGSPPNGICGVTSPKMRRTSRLFPLLPGWMAAPVRPPVVMSRYVPSDKPPDRLSALWQARQCAAKMA
jgi:hypothetical protein